MKDMTGQTFGRLTVIGYAGSTSQGTACWSCRCECGKIVASVRGWCLRSGGTKSCGCLHRVVVSESSKRHAVRHGRYVGIPVTPEGRSYKCLIQRTHDENHKAYKDYGGRGISVCDRWLGPDGYANFLADLGPQPTRDEDWTLDRIDPDGDYCPENCRWLTRADNSRRRWAVACG
jgi:hypothetical protein